MHKHHDTEVLQYCDGTGRLYYGRLYYYKHGVLFLQVLFLFNADDLLILAKDYEQTIFFVVQ